MKGAGGKQYGNIQPAAFLLHIKGLARYAPPPPIIAFVGSINALLTYGKRKGQMKNHPAIQCDFDL
jgi:hypothetical protein